jgi:hypothetical protein
MRKTKLLFIVLFAGSMLFANSCLKCHSGKMAQCRSSLHYTLFNAINITRDAWGIKDSNVTLQTLPEPKTVIHKPADLVDDFLRRKCLRCHLLSRQINKTGNLCLACHNRHFNRFDAKKALPTMQKCLKCHNNEFVGTDYLGLFPHDYDKSYRSPITQNGTYPNTKYGIDQHHLVSDIHYRKGLTCIDCHNKAHTKNKRSWEGQVLCTSCHIHISKKYHKAYHKNIACSTCHSAWSMNNYELNVLRDDTSHYRQWKRLQMQEDPYLKHFLRNALHAKKPPKPVMPDYLDNMLKPGIWYSGWLFRRWENFYLINNKNHKVMIARPMFQYRISYVDKNGQTILNDVTKRNKTAIEVFLPYTPHTITKQAKSCEMCHDNPLLKTDAEKHHILGNILIPKRIVNGSFLTKKQLLQLHSKKYKIIRSRMLFDEKR